jgi:hypothetical protein
MIRTSGELHQRTSLSNILTSDRPAWLELALLIGAGFAIVFAHAALRIPMGLPGRHGLEWMAILIIGRSASKQKWAATTASMSAAGFSYLPIWGFGDPFMWVTYLVPGLVIDAGYNLVKRWQGSILFLAVIAGLAHMTKPLIRFGISLINGWPYGSLLYGVGYPTMTHIAFGLVGGFFGAGLVYYTRKIKKSNN